MPLARKARILPRKSRVRNASTKVLRAATFCDGAQPSSRSKITSSASPAAAFSIIFRECAGQTSSLRRIVMGRSVSACAMESLAIDLGQDYKLRYCRRIVLETCARSYNEGMARGWESKSVESQIESAKDGITSGSGAQSTDQQKKVQRERQGLLLSRTYLLRRIESSSNERYTQSLRQALEEIERKIAKLDGQ